MSYASVEDVQRGFRELSENEAERAEALLEEAAVIIDACRENAKTEAKKVVSCRMVRRALGTGEDGSAMGVPIGATQGTVSALGYSQSWTLQNGSAGEIYLSKTEKKLLGAGDRIGAHSPLEDMTE